MEVRNSIYILEIDGEYTNDLVPSNESPKLAIESHEMGNDGFVVVDVAGHRYVVDAAELLAAVANATNVGHSA